MAEDSWPKSTRNSGTINDYEHEQLESPAQPNGLVGVPTDATLVYGDSTGRQIKVRPNRYGLLRGKTWTSGPAEYIKAIAANTSGSTRIDLVVLRLDRANNGVTLEVRAGVPGAGRPAPVQQVPPATAFGTGIFELPVAQVTVVNNAATITAADVVNLAWYVSASGEILCTSTTRPYGLVDLDQFIYESNTKLRYAWDGAAWQPAVDYRNSKGLVYGKKKSDGVVMGSAITADTVLLTKTITVEPNRVLNMRARVGWTGSLANVTSALLLKEGATQLTASGETDAPTSPYTAVCEVNYRYTTGAAQNSLTFSVVFSPLNGGGNRTVTAYQTLPFEVYVDDVSGQPSLIEA